MRKSSNLDGFRQDLRDALRVLTRRWGFTLVALVSLTLGLGANTALFSLVDALLLRSLPVADPDRLAIVRRALANSKAVPIDAASLEALGHSTSIYSDAALTAVLPSASVAIGNEPEPGRVVAVATANFFAMLGVSPRAGRVTADGEAVAILSDRFWRARFGRDTAVIGQPITVNGQSYGVAGIAAAGFACVSLDSSVDVWLLQPQCRAAAVSAIARLAPGVSIEQAATATAAGLANVDRARGAADADSVRTTVEPGGQGIEPARGRRAPIR